MACCGGSSYNEDVNIGNVNFYPIEIKLSGKKISILDAFGRYLSDQVDQEKQFKEKKFQEEELRTKQTPEDFVHPKVKQAQSEFDQRKKTLALLDSDVELLGLEVEALTDLIIAFSLDNEKLDARMSEIDRQRDVV